MFKRNVNDIPIIKTHGVGADRRALFDRDFRWKSYKGMMVFAEYTVKPNGEFIPHRHGREEIYYFLEADGSMTVGKEATKVRDGDAIYIPSYTPHHFVNGPKKAARVIVVAWGRSWRPPRSKRTKPEG